VPGGVGVSNGMVGAELPHAEIDVMESTLPAMTAPRTRAVLLMARILWPAGRAAVIAAH
jgi:hypothetical protein